jgi:hypothetical protein
MRLEGCVSMQLQHRVSRPSGQHTQEENRGIFINTYSISRRNYIFSAPKRMQKICSTQIPSSSEHRKLRRIRYERTPAVQTARQYFCHVCQPFAPKNGLESPGKPSEARERGCQGKTLLHSPPWDLDRCSHRHTELL